MLGRPGTCSQKDVLRAWSTCVGRATALPEEKTSSGWSRLWWSLAQALQPTCLLCSNSAQTEASVSGQSPCHPTSSALSSPLGMCRAWGCSVLSKASVHCWACSGLTCSLSSVASPGSLPCVGRTDLCLIYTTPLMFLPLFPVLPVL